MCAQSKQRVYLVPDVFLGGKSPCRYWTVMKRMCADLDLYDEERKPWQKTNTKGRSRSWITCIDELQTPHHQTRQYQQLFGRPPFPECVNRVNRALSPFLPPMISYVILHSRARILIIIIVRLIIITVIINIVILMS